MRIEKIHIKGFRNFEDEEIFFQPKTLIIGANDVGKTNLLYALRILFDKSIIDLSIINHFSSPGKKKSLHYSCAQKKPPDWATLREIIMKKKSFRIFLNKVRRSLLMRLVYFFLLKKS